MVYVCGYGLAQTSLNFLDDLQLIRRSRSSGKMPQAVREAIISVFEVEGKLPREEAEAHLVGLEKSGRYQQETW